MAGSPRCGVVYLNHGKESSQGLSLRLPPQARVLVPFWNARVPPGSSLEIGFDLVCPGRGREKFTAALWGPFPHRLSFRKTPTRLCSWEADTLQLHFRPRRAFLSLRLSGGARLSLLGFTWRSDSRLESERRPAPRGAAQGGFPSYSQGQGPRAIAGRICSPTSLAMACAGLSRRGVRYGAWAWKAFDPGSDLFGNWSFGTAAAAELMASRSLRVACHPAFLSGLDHAARVLEKGFPLILSVRYKKGELRGAPIRESAGHLVLLRGLGPGGALVHDPAGRTAREVPKVYDIRQLDRAWTGSGRLAYVFRRNSRQRGSSRVRTRRSGAEELSSS